MFPLIATRADHLDVASHTSIANILILPWALSSMLIASPLCLVVGAASASSVDVVSGDPKDWPMYNHD
ncbi:MAG: hypothetical protein L0219_21600, partial [Phycisphaerales bacterium]|nr:hypothetical protein [Phycisphaerales bacterium]